MLESNMEKVLVPMKFYNLKTHTVEDYDVNIVEEFNFITRVDVDMPNISEKPRVLVEIFADVYDKDENSVYDDIILLSYGELTDIQDIVFEIEKLQTPEILEHRDRRYRAMMKKILEDKIIEKIVEDVYGEENHDVKKR